ncbi:zinc finger protein 552-like [Contarinia nasturtii]|uniref:zinc finger protein 552-like n=1 Tax=Contarinia nasturtii TaxID=265458 RepID=UPI0012D42466|nr:zinc finger protein 552-like [Contarinia nasturtii]
MANCETALFIDSSVSNCRFYHRPNSNANMTCNHRSIKNYDRNFVEFWHEYFQSTGAAVREISIKYFLSSKELLILCDLSKCKCKDLIQKLYSITPYTCKLCHKMFSTKSSLNNHRLEHIELHECVFCEKRLATKKALKDHLELHTKENTCKACNQIVPAVNVEKHEKCKKHLKNVQMGHKRSIQSK